MTTTAGSAVVLRGGAPWGFRLEGDGSPLNPLRISKLTSRGKAAVAGVHVGDVLLRVNGRSVIGWTSAAATRLMKSESRPHRMTGPGSGELHKYDEPADEVCLTLHLKQLASIPVPDRNSWAGDNDIYYLIQPVCEPNFVCGQLVPDKAMQPTDTSSPSEVRQQNLTDANNNTNKSSPSFYLFNVSRKYEANTDTGNGSFCCTIGITENSGERQHKEVDIVTSSVPSRCDTSEVRGSIGGLHYIDIGTMSENLGSSVLTMSRSSSEVTCCGDESSRLPINPMMILLKMARERSVSIKSNTSGVNSVDSDFTTSENEWKENEITSLTRSNIEPVNVVLPGKTADKPGEGTSSKLMTCNDSCGDGGEHDQNWNLSYDRTDMTIGVDRNHSGSDVDGGESCCGEILRSVVIFEGVGPIDKKTGMPIAPRCCVDKKNQSDWYKYMYRSLHHEEDETLPDANLNDCPGQEGDQDIKYFIRKVSDADPNVKRYHGTVWSSTSSSLCSISTSTRPAVSSPFTSRDSLSSSSSSKNMSDWRPPDVSYTNEIYTNNNPHSVEDYVPGIASSLITATGVL